MKRIILYVLLAAPVLSKAQQPFNIKGKLNNWEEDAKIYLGYSTQNGAVIDSFAIGNGEFSFEGTVSEITAAIIYIMPTNLQPKHFVNGQLALDQKIMYLDKGEIIVTSKDSLKNALITGSAINEERKRYETATGLKNTLEKFAILRAELANAPEAKQNDSAFRAQVEAKWQEIIKEDVENKKLFIKQNPSSYFSLEAVMDMVKYERAPSLLQASYKNLSGSLRSSWYGQQVAKEMETFINTSIGGKAPAITLPDSSGKQIRLSDFKGKYVLIDFWASWCKPCRAENPNLVTAYKNHHSKGFEILGISLDEESYKDKWLDAVKQDGLIWPQLNDLKGANGAVVQSYGVKEIPKNFLVGPDGTIVVVGLRGDALNKKLYELLGK